MGSNGNFFGFWNCITRKKAAMLCTASVEEVIEDHYENQIKKLGNDEMDLKAKIEKFKARRDFLLNHQKYCL